MTMSTTADEAALAMIRARARAGDGQSSPGPPLGSRTRSSALFQFRRHQRGRRPSNGSAERAIRRDARGAPTGHSTTVEPPRPHRDRTHVRTGVEVAPRSRAIRSGPQPLGRAPRSSRAGADKSAARGPAARSAPALPRTDTHATRCSARRQVPPGRRLVRRAATPSCLDATQPVLPAATDCAEQVRGVWW